MHERQNKSPECFSTPIKRLKHSPGFHPDTPVGSTGASSSAVQGACPSEGEREASGSGGAGRQCGGCRAPPSEDWLAARPRRHGDSRGPDLPPQPSIMALALARLYFLSARRLQEFSLAPADISAPRMLSFFLPWPSLLSIPLAYGF